MDTGLETLGRDECLRLLASVPVGRIVYSDGALPSCAPVNFALDGAAVAFRTVPGSRIATATDDAVVAFEVDHVDPDDCTGWSVLVTGTARVVRDTGTAVRLDQLALVSWVGADRTQWVRITPTIITGRMLRTVPVA